MRIYLEQFKSIFLRKHMFTATLVIFLSFLSDSIHAQGSAPYFTYQGMVMNAAGNAPLTGNITYVAEIYDPSGNCLLYSENQIQNTTNGLFTIQIGSAIGPGKRNSAFGSFADDPGLSVATVFTNKGELRAAGAPNCAAGYSPNPADTRILKLHVSDDGAAYTTLADQVLTPVPQAIVAGSLEGIPSVGFVQTWSAHPANPQTNQTGFNLTTGKLEKWNGAAWVDLIPKFSTNAISGGPAFDNYIMRWDDSTGEWIPSPETSITAANIGAGTAIYDAGTTQPFNFKTLTSTGASVTISSTANTVNLEVSPSSVGALSGNGTQYTLPMYSTATPSSVLANSVVSQNAAGTTATINAGTSITGGLSVAGGINSNSQLITNVLTPVAGTDAANKNYVDTAVSDTVMDGTSAGQILKWDTGDSRWEPVNVSNVVIDASDRLGLAATPNEILTLNGSISFQELGASPSATAGFGKVYVKSDNKIYFRADSGTEYDLTYGGDVGGGATAVSSVEGNTGAVDLANAIAGTTPTFVTTGTSNGTATLNIPMASTNTTTAGLISYAEYTAFNGKQAALTNGTTGQILKWDGDSWEPVWNSILTRSNSNTTALSVDTAGVVSVTDDHALTSGNHIADRDYVLAQITAGSNVDDGTANGQLLRWNSTNSDWEPITLASGQILIGDGAVPSVATPRSMSGDAALSTTGVLTIATDAVGSSEIIDDSVTAADLALTVNNTFLMRNNAGTEGAVTVAVCGAGNYSRWDGSAWVCAADTNAGGDLTDIVAGSGLTGTSLTGPSPTLNVGAGTGITVNADDIAVNTAVIQARVTGTCAAGSSIRVIASDGSVTCETDDTSTGDIDNVGVTSPITGGGASGSVTIGIQQATTAQAGYLSAADWNTFNGKVGGSGTAGRIPRFSAGSTLGDSSISDTGSAATANGQLKVNGPLVTRDATSDDVAEIDFSTGNIQYTSRSCQAFTLYNMQNGGTYTLAVQGGTSALCSFSAYSGAGVGGLTVKMPPDHDFTIATKHTLYNFIVAGSYVYVSAIAGY